ncbi:MAG: hypothetical protein KJ069_31310 [Anaerolineae bacterium]|nr:hypothetical protein [Anaerolineae bacterium]
MSRDQDKDNLQGSTLAALLKDRQPKRGRPSHPISRQNVYIALTPAQKQILKQLAAILPEKITRADVPDLAITALTARLEGLHRAVADRTRTIPEGVTDLESLYLLWDLPLPGKDDDATWTSIRVSPQQVLDLGRAHGTLNAAFGATRSQTFVLGIALLIQSLEDHPPDASLNNLDVLRHHINHTYL